MKSPLSSQLHDSILENVFLSLLSSAMLLVNFVELVSSSFCFVLWETRQCLKFKTNSAN